jgi:hypothetical protein
MKRIAVICLAMVLMLIPLIGMSCDCDEESKIPESNDIGEYLYWNGNETLTWTLYQDPDTLEETYTLFCSGSLQNLHSSHTVDIYSIIIRFYDSNDEVLGEHVTDLSASPEFQPAQIHNINASGVYSYGPNYYEVFVTDNNGNEYHCHTWYPGKEQLVVIS